MLYICSTIQLDFINVRYEPSNFSSHRENRIVPYDETRVHLASAALYKDYVNASWVNTGKFRMISAQSPLPQSVEHFLQMVQENEVSVIVTLTREGEKEGNSTEIT